MLKSKSEFTFLKTKRKKKKKKFEYKQIFCRINNFNVENIGIIPKNLKSLILVTQGNRHVSKWKVFFKF